MCQEFVVIDVYTLHVIVVIVIVRYLQNLAESISQDTDRGHLLNRAIKSPLTIFLRCSLNPYVRAFASPMNCVEH